MRLRMLFDYFGEMFWVGWSLCPVPTRIIITFLCVCVLFNNSSHSSCAWAMIIFACADHSHRHCIKAYNAVLYVCVPFLRYALHCTSMAYGWSICQVARIMLSRIVIVMIRMLFSSIKLKMNSLNAYNFKEANFSMALTFDICTFIIAFGEIAQLHFKASAAYIDLFTSNRSWKMWNQMKNKNYTKKMKTKTKQKNQMQNLMYKV